MINVINQIWTDWAVNNSREDKVFGTLNLKNLKMDPWFGDNFIDRARYPIIDAIIKRILHAKTQS